MPFSPEKIDARARSRYVAVRFARAAMARVSVPYFVDDVDVAIDFCCRGLGCQQVMHPAPSFAMLSHGDLRRP